MRTCALPFLVHSCHIFETSVKREDHVCLHLKLVQQESFKGVLRKVYPGQYRMLVVLLHREYTRDIQLQSTSIQACSFLE